MSSSISLCESGVHLYDIVSTSARRCLPAKRHILASTGDIYIFTRSRERIKISLPLTPSNCYLASNSFIFNVAAAPSILNRLFSGIFYSAAYAC